MRWYRLTIRPPLQLSTLKKAGCKTIFKDEGISGATVKRPALTRCLKTLRPGDTLIVWKLDRLGHSLRATIYRRVTAHES
jgi:DNA invertase Pin-like site-specific DNA recombinase